MLSTQFPAKLQPVVEEMLPCLDDLEVLQGDILITLGLVVGIDFLQTLVEQVREQLQVCRAFGKLDQPLVTAFRIGIHKHWCCGIFRDLCPRLFTGVGQTLLCIVDDQFLTKGIDEMLGAPSDDKLIGIGRRKLDGIAYLVTPQATAGGNHHRIVLTRFHTPERHGVASVHGNKLIEDIIVEHQQHRLVVRVILQAEEALAGVIRLHIVHLRRGDELLILLTVRREGHTPVEEHLDIGPHVFQMRLARYLHHPGEHGEHP